MFSPGKELNAAKQKKIKELELEKKDGSIQVLDDLLEVWCQTLEIEETTKKLKEITSRTDLMDEYLKDQGESLQGKIIMKSSSDEPLNSIESKILEEGLDPTQELSALFDKLFKNLSSSENKESAIISTDTIKKIFEKNSDLALYLLNNTSFMKKEGENYSFKFPIVKEYFKAQQILHEINQIAPKK